MWLNNYIFAACQLGNRQENIRNLRITICPIHQHVYEQGSISPTFFVRIFCTNVVLAAFSSYALALTKNSYEKCMGLTLMKSTKGFTYAYVQKARVASQVINVFLPFEDLRAKKLLVIDLSKVVEKKNIS